VLKCFEKFLRFFGKMTLTKNFHKFCSETFYRDIDRRVVFVKFGRREIVEIVRFYPDKKETKFCLALQLSLLLGSRPKSARASPGQCTQSAPDFIQIGSFFGGVIAERVITTKTRRKVNPIFG